MNSWYTEMSGVHFKLGLWWVPEKVEGEMILYRGYEEAPPGAGQTLTKRQKEMFQAGEEELRCILAANEFDGDEPRFVFPLYRNGVPVGIRQEYIRGHVRVVKTYMYAVYGSARAASAACCWDDEFRAFLNKFA